MVEIAGSTTTTFPFSEGTTDSVRVHNTATNGHVIVDAVAFELLP